MCTCWHSWCISLFLFLTIPNPSLVGVVDVSIFCILTNAYFGRLSFQKRKIHFYAHDHFIEYIICRFLPYVGWTTIIMTENPIVKVWSLLLFFRMTDFRKVRSSEAWTLILCVTIVLLAVYCYGHYGIALFDRKGIDILIIFRRK